MHFFVAFIYLIFILFLFYFIYLYFYLIGKTSILERYVKDTFRGTSKMTIGVDFLVKDVIIHRDTFATVAVWDTAGQGTPQRNATQRNATQRNATQHNATQ